jgi:uncharacterized membrane protein YkoI
MKGQITALFAGAALLGSMALAAQATKAAAAKDPKTQSAGDAAVHQDIPANLAKQAKVPLEAARATALAKVPGGRVQSEELEREHGRLIYSFDIKVPGRAGVEEVNVSAVTGKVVGKHHESDRSEKTEQQREKKPPPPAPPGTGR